MDMFANQLSALTVQDVQEVQEFVPGFGVKEEPLPTWSEPRSYSPIVTLDNFPKDEPASTWSIDPRPYTSIVSADSLEKAEPTVTWSTDSRPYTPIASADSFASSSIDSYEYSPSSTLMNLTPAEIDAGAPYSSDLISYDYKPTFYRLDNSDILITNDMKEKDDGYMSSPNRQTDSISPPSASYTPLADSANESGNSNELAGLAEPIEIPPYPFRFTATLQQQPQFHETQCVKCGCMILIEDCIKEASGQYLCYTCGVQNVVYEEAQPEEREEGSPPPSKRGRKAANAANARKLVCHNCKCTSTTLWRRDSQGETVCNACGLYDKLHGRSRPITMRKDTIQTRRRKPRNANTAQSKKRAAAFTRAATRLSVYAPRAVPAQYPSLPPPPPYNRYAAANSAAYQFPQPIENNIYFGNYNTGVSYHQFNGNMN